MESKTFTYETYYEHSLSFEIDDTHFKYRLDDGEQIVADWKDIQSLKINRFGNTLEIPIKNQPKPITVPFGTENFLVFLEEITSRLGKANAEMITHMEEPFTVSRAFYVMMGLFMTAPIILLAGLVSNFSSLMSTQTYSAYVAFLAPAALFIYGVCIIIRAQLKSDRLLLNGLIRRSVYPYDTIKSIGFELLDMKKRGSLLVVVLHMKNGKKIKVKWLKELMLFYIVLKFKLEQYQR